MATSKTYHRDVIICDLCDNQTQKFCNSCQASLCNDCISEHIEELKSVSHDVVSFFDRTIRLRFPACENHPSHRCKVHCMDCNEPVCKKCIFLGPHQGHASVSYKKRRHEIKTETQEIKQKLFPKYQKEDADAGGTIFKTETKLDELGEENKQLRQLWHKEVDTIFDKIDSQCQSLRDGKLKALKTYQEKIKVLISRINESIEENETILQTTTFSDLGSYESKLKEFRDFPEKVKIRMPKFNTKIDRGKKLVIEIGDYRITLKHTYHPTLTAVTRLTRIWELINGDRVNATISTNREPLPDIDCDWGTEPILTQVYHRSLSALSDLTTSLKERGCMARVIAIITTKYKPLLDIACVGEADAWICGNKKTITRINIYGSVMDKITTTCQYGPRGISVSRKGELIYGHSDKRIVHIVREAQSEALLEKIAYCDGGNEAVCVVSSLPDRLIKLPRDWRPGSICCTRYGDILVHMSGTLIPDTIFQNKIICFDRQKITQEIQSREHVSPTFMNGCDRLYISDNINGDICVSDTNANIVVVLDSSGSVLFRYDGTPADRKTPFDPRCIVTDALGQIIVADYNNNCLHILDENGQFLGCIDDCELVKPHGLSVDNEGRLWVGLCDLGTIKVIEYQ